MKKFMNLCSKRLGTTALEATKVPSALNCATRCICYCHSVLLFPLLLFSLLLFFCLSLELYFILYHILFVGPDLDICHQRPINLKGITFTAEIKGSNKANALSFILNHAPM